MSFVKKAMTTGISLGNAEAAEQLEIAFGSMPSELMEEAEVMIDEFEDESDEVIQALCELIGLSVVMRIPGPLKERVAEVVARLDTVPAKVYVEVRQLLVSDGLLIVVVSNDRGELIGQKTICEASTGSMAK